MTQQSNVSRRADAIENAASIASDKAESGWWQIGENVSQALAMARRGEREKTVTVFAGHYETYPNRIWKAVSAYEFVSILADRRLKRLLADQPLSNVDIISLWARHDQAGALNAASEMIEGRHTFQTLIAAERAARPNDVSTVVSRAAAWREAAKRILLEGEASGYKDHPTPGGLADLPIDLWLERRKKLLGVHLLGPFPHQRDYNRNAPRHFLTSLGLAYLGHLSWIALPAGTAGPRYKEIAGRVAPGVVKVVELEMPDFSSL